MKKVICLLLSTIMLLSIFCTAYAKEFPDVPQDHWAYQYVNELSEKGIIDGYEDGTYMPNGEVTKAEFIKLIVGAVDEKTRSTTDYTIKSYGKTGFFDGKEWYYEPYIRAYKLHLCELINSDEVKEEMNAPISRIEIAEILYNYCNLYSLVDVKNEDDDEAVEMVLSSILETFNDLNGDSGIDYDETFKLYEVNKIGLLNGYDDGTFKPFNNLTRAEVATVISRCLNLRKDR